MKKHSPELIAKLWTEALSMQASAKQKFEHLLSQLECEAGYSESGEFLDNFRELLDFNLMALPQEIDAEALALKVSQLTLWMLQGDENNKLATMYDEIEM